MTPKYLGPRSISKRIFEKNLVIATSQWLMTKTSGQSLCGVVINIMLICFDCLDVFNNVFVKFRSASNDSDASSSGNEIAALRSKVEKLEDEIRSTRCMICMVGWLFRMS